MWSDSFMPHVQNAEIGPRQDSLRPTTSRGEQSQVGNDRPVLKGAPSGLIRYVTNKHRDENTQVNDLSGGRTQDNPIPGRTRM